jgi:hypothetical protein
MSYAILTLEDAWVDSFALYTFFFKDLNTHDTVGHTMIFFIKRKFKNSEKYVCVNGWRCSDICYWLARAARRSTVPQLNGSAPSRSVP